ncbi:MAG: hypothetical protein JNM39_17940 [Bdellovibrionaceae bacterium]|nr:hypothetical protein [Pseudobdellovibrionaceae bacterium]
MTLLERADKMITKAIERHEKVQGIVIPDFEEFVLKNGVEFIRELTYLYLTYEEILFLAIFSIIKETFQSDLDFEIEIKKKPALYLKFSDYDLELMQGENKIVGITEDDRSWKLLSTEGHHMVHQIALKFGFHHLAKKASKNRDRLIRHLNQK